MAGALICGIFRQEFRRVITEMQKHLQKDINNQRRDLTQRLSKLENYIKADAISRGLKTALSTGNWGKDKDQKVLKTGVS
jgi:DNA-directed RNA polymerase II subunit RPB2